MPDVEVRRGMPDVRLSREQFEARLLARFYDPVFDGLGPEIDRIVAAAWDAYSNSRKAPRTRPAGAGYADPSYELSIDWIDARARILSAQDRQSDPATPSRILIVNGSTRSDHTCPGEISKTWRLAEIAAQVVEAAGFEADILDLSRLASEYGRNIYPCKACVSTAQPLCHWPCSCYPNHGLGQENDWMAEIYPQWVAAHGVMVVCPVNWYQAPSSFKLMIDRLVCADGGNPDPTSTHGKDPARAKALELAGWPYPRHLAGRTFAVFVHGDSAGAETLARNLSDWMSDMGMIPAGHLAQVGTWIGYLKPYATSHAELDADKDVQEDMRNAARALVESVRLMRAGKLRQGDAGLRATRQK
jgi:multimeric flavodoxin WrbA